MCYRFLKWLFVGKIVKYRIRKYRINITGIYVSKMNGICTSLPWNELGLSFLLLLFIVYIITMVSSSSSTSVTSLTQYKLLL